MFIKEVYAKKIKDSRSEDTIEVSVNKCKASAPEGKSKGKYETPAYYQSLDWNIRAINLLKFNFPIKEFQDLKKIEDHIISVCEFSNAKEFGANALFALESAILKALARSKKKQLWEIINLKATKLPTPLGNAVGGGQHSEQFSAHPVFQEFLVIPKGRDFKDKLRNMNEVYEKLGKLLKAKSKNDEGAWQCALSEEEILDLLSKFKFKVRIGLDAASSSFYKDGEYQYHEFDLNTDEQIKYINNLIEKYNLLYIEDPLQEEDFIKFKKIKKKALVSGDDLTATNIKRLKKAIFFDSINAMIIKPNQNGSLLEVAEIFEICKKNRIKTILSHRSGETMDSAIADLAFGFQADYIKCGISTKWRESKLNRLLEIDNSLKK
jgi:enolase